MATRMQQRRGTSTQWTTANPVLNIGEIGYETDTNQFKIGDGTNHWNDLSYFIDETALNTSLGDYVETSLLGVADGVATLNSSGVLESSQLPDIAEITADTMNDVLVAGSGIAKSYDDNANTLTLSVDASILDEMSQDAINAALTAGTGITKTYDDNANTITLAVDTTVIATKAELAEVAQDSINDALIAGTGLTKAYDDNANTLTVAIDSTVATLTGSQTLTNKNIDLANNTITGTISQFNDALQGDNFFLVESIDQNLKNKSINLGVGWNTLTGLEANKFLTTDSTGSLNQLNQRSLPNGDVVGTSDSQTLTNKILSGATINGANANNVVFSLSNNTLTGTIAQFNTALSDGDFATIAGTETLLNKTIDLGNNIISGTLDQFNNAITDANILPTSGGTLTGFLTLHADPTQALHPATKQYVDAVSEGLHVHKSVVAASTANITLPTAPATMDGVTLNINDRVLLKDQTAKAENGIYVVINGDLARAADYNTAEEIDAGDFVFVSGGTTYESTGWVQENNIATLGTDAIEWIQFSGAGTYLAGSGLTLTGSTFSVNIGTDVQAYSNTLTNVVDGTYVGNINLNTLGNVTTGTWSATTIGLEYGGTGATTQSGAANAILPSQGSNSGKYLTTDGTNVSWSPVSAGVDEAMIIMGAL